MDGGGDFKNDPIIRAAKGYLLQTMREDAEGLRVDLQNALDHCRALQRQIEKANDVGTERGKVLEELLQERDKKLFDLQMVVTSLRCQTERQKQKEYVPCDAIRRRHLMDDAAEMRKLKGELDAAVAEKKAVQQAWLDLDDQMQAALKIKDGYQTQAKSLEEELMAVNRKMNGLKNEYETQLASFENIISKKDATLKGTEDRLILLEKELSATKEEKKTMQHALMEQDGNVRAGLKMKEEYQVQTKVLEQELMAVNQKMKVLKNDYETQLASLENTMSKKDAALKVRDDRLIALEKELMAMKAAEKTMQHALMERDGHMQAGLKVKDEYQAQAKALEEELMMVNRKMDVTERDCEEKVASLKNIISTKDAALAAKEDRLIALEKELSAMKQKTVQHAWMERNGHYGQVQASPKVKDEYQAQAKSLEEELTAVNQKMSVLKNDYEMKLASLENIMSKKDVTIKVKEDRLVALEKELSALTEAARYAEKHQTKVITYEKEVPPKINDLRFEDLTTRLRNTEEHLGEMRRDNNILEGELDDTRFKLEQSEAAYKKLYSTMKESLDKITLYKKERDYYEKMYKSFTEKTQIEMKQKDSKIAQQDKLIIHLQTRIPTSKTFCCLLPEKKPAGRLSMDELGKALDLERAKNVDLTAMVRRLQQQLNEKRMRRSFSEERFPTAKEN